jgi:hypothetical protein
MIARVRYILSVMFIIKIVHEDRISEQCCSSVH